MNRTEQVVFIVDDDEAVRDSLKMLLRASGMQVETYASAASFLKGFGLDRPGCLVLDVRMPGMSGLALQDELSMRKIRIPVIFLTGHADVPMAVRALKDGAFDFIEKPIESRRLVGAVHDALKADAEQRSRHAQRANRSTPAKADLSHLSEREREVMERVVQGMQTRTIAEELGISIKTVEFHRARIREKLGVTTLADMLRIFLA
ncbi:response regulator transcription factor [Herbaspirillum sp. HC18]|nr:response regulator transcription factor [Herbaspirillum sp. HC18]